MIKRDFDLEEMKYFLNLVELSTDDYLYIFDFNNDRIIYSKSITDVFPFESNAFENATAQLKAVVHPDDIDMLMKDLQEGINGRRKEHNLEYSWKYNSKPSKPSLMHLRSSSCIPSFLMYSI